MTPQHEKGAPEAKVGAKVGLHGVLESGDAHRPDSAEEYGATCERRGIGDLPFGRLLTLGDFVERIEPAVFQKLLKLWATAAGTHNLMAYLRSINQPIPVLTIAASASWPDGAQFRAGWESTQEVCEQIGLTRTADTLASVLKDPSSDLAALGPELMRCIEGDLKRSIILMRIPGQKARYWAQPMAFGQAVFDRFEHARVDIEEAGNCYAAGRNTACVLHLMRVMEHALREMASTLDIPDPIGAERNWTSIIGKVRTEIEVRSKHPVPRAWKAVKDFYGGAVGLLEGARDAFRNTSMHVGEKYDEGDALRIYEFVQGFMVHMAKLPLELTPL